MFFKKIELLKTINSLKNGDLNLITFINSLCDRIDQVEPFIESLLPEQNRRQRLLKEANDLLLKYPNPENRPSLFGLPVGIKDLYRVDGFTTSCGSKLPSNLFEGKEAEIVTNLKQQGALILGKTVTTEFAYFQPGPTKNPNNIDYTPGGSSSGSAAAVAAGITPLAFGTQTIGSITRPASFCGVIGVKPSTESISAEGVIPFSTTFDHIGFFTHDIEGAELVSSLFCKEWNNTDENYNLEPTVGIPSDEYLSQTNDDIKQEFDFYIEKIEKCGYRTVKTSLFKEIEKINSLHKLLAAKDFADVHNVWFKEYQNLYSNHSTELINNGKKVTNEEVQEILKYREYVLQEMNDIMDKEKIDVWASPSTLSLPPKGLSSTGSPLMNLPWTFIGVPTISLPIITSNLSLPTGLQLSGKLNGLKNLFLHSKLIKSSLKI